MYGTVAKVKRYAPKLDYSRVGFATSGEYDTFLTELLTAVSERINLILPQGEVTEDDPTFGAVTEVAVRRVANILPLVTQMNTSPIMRVGEFTVEVISMSKFFDGLDKELEDLYEYGEGMSADDFSISISGGVVD